ncbi:unnamed protein product [Amoebophrya sp. A25]|nr:unnamed protein product [Amoebophrya sp. A25]|eukprot:GSA25T00009160001.1
MANSVRLVTYALPVAITTMKMRPIFPLKRMQIALCRGAPLRMPLKQGKFNVAAHGYFDNHLRRFSLLATPKSGHVPLHTSSKPGEQADIIPCVGCTGSSEPSEDLSTNGPRLSGSREIQARRWENCEKAVQWFLSLLEKCMPDYEYERLPHYVHGTVLVRPRQSGRSLDGPTDSSGLSTKEAMCSQEEEATWQALMLKSTSFQRRRCGFTGIPRGVTTASSKSGVLPVLSVDRPLNSRKTSFFSSRVFLRDVGLVAAFPPLGKVKALHLDDVRITQGRCGAHTMRVDFPLSASTVDVETVFAAELAALLGRLPHKTRKQWHRELPGCKLNSRHAQVVGEFVSRLLTPSGIVFEVENRWWVHNFIIGGKRSLIRIGAVKQHAGGHRRVRFSLQKNAAKQEEHKNAETPISVQDGIDVFIALVHDAGRLQGLFVLSGEWMDSVGNLQREGPESFSAGRTKVTLTLPPVAGAIGFGVVSKVCLDANAREHVISSYIDLLDPAVDYPKAQEKLRMLVLAANAAQHEK